MGCRHQLKSATTASRIIQNTNPAAEGLGIHLCMHSRIHAFTQILYFLSMAYVILQYLVFKCHAIAFTEHLPLGQVGLQALRILRAKKPDPRVRANLLSEGPRMHIHSGFNIMRITRINSNCLVV